jgi:hypothetical protein
VEAVRPEWFAGWQAAGIDMTTIPTERYYWQDYEALRLFAAHGAWAFWFDDVWDQDWEACWETGRQAGVAGLPERPVRRPPPGTAAACWVLDRTFRVAQRVKRLLVRRRPRFAWE